MSLFRVWSIGGSLAITAAVCVMALAGGRDASKVEDPAAVLQAEVRDEVDATAHDVPQARRFPAFAPEGVIVVRAPSAEERPFAAHRSGLDPRAHARVRRELVRTTERRQGRAERLQQRGYGSGAAPVAGADANVTPARDPVEPAEMANTQDHAETPRDTRSTQDANVPNGEVYEQERDDRSWYRSRAYWRDLEQRRRAERQAQRRFNGGL